MNEMELLRELAQETPLPAPAELDAARARLVAAITTDPAAYATAVAQATVGQPDPPAGPLQPSAPKQVRTAAKLMYGGAVGPAAELLGALPYMGDIHGKALGHPLTATPLTVTVVTVFFLLPIALWLWMARAVRQGRNWARIPSAVLLGLQTLWLLVIGPTYVELFFDLLSWLTGLAAVWLLWRPASSAFFKLARAARSRPPSQISGP